MPFFAASSAGKRSPQFGRFAGPRPEKETRMLHLAVAEGVHRVEDAYTNWYAVEDGDELTIVDTGHPRSWASLHELLRIRKRRPAAVVLTHAHFDHMGFAERARTKLRVKVHAHELEVPVTRHPLRYDHERSRIPYMLRYPGFDRAFAAMTLMGALFVKGLESVHTFRDGDELDVPGRPRVIFTPGHTHGHCALHFPDRGVLIAGDAFVTYNPYTDSDGAQIVSGAATADSARALASLDRLVELDADVALTGHGEPWRGPLAEAVAAARERGAT
jgi:glyoxylase-like metal-dependent hydrolase (beta-lactamase superfamily II)